MASPAWLIREVTADGVLDVLFTRTTLERAPRGRHGPVEHCAQHWSSVTELNPPSRRRHTRVRTADLDPSPRMFGAGRSPSASGRTSPGIDPTWTGRRPAHVAPALKKCATLDRDHLTTVLATFSAEATLLGPANDADGSNRPRTFPGAKGAARDEGRGGGSPGEAKACR